MEPLSVPKSLNRGNTWENYDPVSFTKSHWEQNLLGKWPASRNYQVESLNSEKKKGYFSSNENSPQSITHRSRKIDLQAKPKMVIELESFLLRELKTAETEEEEYTCYRECFKRFISSFKTYRPLLSSILNNFEKRIHSLEVSNRTKDKKRYELHQLEEDLEVRVHKVKMEHQMEIKKLKKEHLDQQIEDKELKQNVYHQKETIEHLKADLNQIKEDIEQERNRSGILTQALQDSSLENRSLKIKLKEAEAKVKSHRKIQKLYQNSIKRLKLLDQMVPKEKYDKLNEESLSHKSLSDKLNRSLRFMRKANQRLKDEIIDLKLELNSQEDDIIHNEKIIERAKAEIIGQYTPRPNWSKGKSILHQWKKFHQKKEDLLKHRKKDIHHKHRKELVEEHRNGNELTTKEMCQCFEEYVTELKDEMSKKDERLKDQKKILTFLNEQNLITDDGKNRVDIPFFIGKGKHSGIPKFLRFNGKIKNKNFSKREVEDYLNEIWMKRKAKTITTNKTNSSSFLDLSSCLTSSTSYTNSSFHDFFDEFVCKKYKTQKEKSEFVYNLIHGCEKFRFDPDCDVFLKVLRKEIAEEFYWKQFELVDSFKQLLIEMDRENAIKQYLHQKELSPSSPSPSSSSPSISPSTPLSSSTTTPSTPKQQQQQQAKKNKKSKKKNGKQQQQQEEEEKKKKMTKKSKKQREKILEKKLLMEKEKEAKEEMLKNVPLSGIIQKDDLLERLDDFFKTKTSEDLSELKSILNDSEEDQIEYEKLFLEDENHTQSELIEVIRHQYIIESEQYLVDIEESLINLKTHKYRSWEDSEDSNDHYHQQEGEGEPKEIYLKDIKRVLMNLDPHKPKKEIDLILSYGLGKFHSLHPKGSDWKKPIHNMKQFVKNIRKKAISRSTKKSSVEMILENRKKKERTLERFRQRSMTNLLNFPPPQTSKEEEDDDNDDSDGESTNNEKDKENKAEENQLVK